MSANRRVAMRPLSQALIEAIFAVTDAIPMSREALRIPLARVGAGSVARGKDGRFEVTLPAEEQAVAPFLATLPAALHALGVEVAPPRPPGA